MDDVRITVFQESGRRVSRASKKEYASFMSSSVPKQAPKENRLAESKDDEESQDYRNDLALKRLLAESNLLDGNDLQPRGASRHAAIQSRIEMLGGLPAAKQNHSWRIRKGLEEKKERKRKKKENEEKEAGIILPKSKRKSVSSKVRDRGLNVQEGVGKFKRGKLTLYKNI